MMTSQNTLLPARHFDFGREGILSRLRCSRLAKMRWGEAIASSTLLLRLFRYGLPVRRLIKVLLEPINRGEIDLIPMHAKGGIRSGPPIIIVAGLIACPVQQELKLLSAGAARRSGDQA